MDLIPWLNTSVNKYGPRTTSTPDMTWEFVEQDIEQAKLAEHNCECDEAHPLNREALTACVAFLARLKVGGFPPPFATYGMCSTDFMSEWGFGEHASMSIHFKNRGVGWQAEILIYQGQSKQHDWAVVPV